MGFKISTFGQENHEEPQQHGGDDDDQRKKTVARHALLVTQRTQAVDPAGGQIVDEPGIAGRRAAKMIAQAAPQRRQVVFAHAQLVEKLGFRVLSARGELGVMNFLKNRSAGFWSRCGNRFFNGPGNFFVRGWDG